MKKKFFLHDFFLFDFFGVAIFFGFSLSQKNEMVYGSKSENVENSRNFNFSPLRSVILVRRHPK